MKRKKYLSTFMAIVTMSLATCSSQGTVSGTEDSGEADMEQVEKSVEQEPGEQEVEKSTIAEKTKVEIPLINAGIRNVLSDKALTIEVGESDYNEFLITDDGQIQIANVFSIDKMNDEYYRVIPEAGLAQVYNRDYELVFSIASKDIDQGIKYRHIVGNLTDGNKNFVLVTENKQEFEGDKRYLAVYNMDGQIVDEIEIKSYRDFYKNGCQIQDLEKEDRYYQFDFNEEKLVETDGSALITEGTPLTTVDLSEYEEYRVKIYGENGATAGGNDLYEDDRRDLEGWLQTNGYIGITITNKESDRYYTIYDSNGQKLFEPQRGIIENPIINGRYIIHDTGDETVKCLGIDGTAYWEMPGTLRSVLRNVIFISSEDYMAAYDWDGNFLYDAIWYYEE